jgi:hypothetical protein
MPPVGEALEYITQMLSARGPQAVPYPEATKWNIREHLSELLKVPPPPPTQQLSDRPAGAPAHVADRQPPRVRTGVPHPEHQMQRVPRQ